jgi:release factor glutamine methyltransferase
MADVLERPRSWVLAHDEHMLSPAEILSFSGLVRRRFTGEPVAYLRGHVEWYDLDLVVTPEVLIPRPETELLLETGVRLARSVGARVIADVGTGSGAIAIGLARALPAAIVIAIDASEGAVDVARRNIIRYGVQDRVQTRHGSLLEPFDAQPDLLIANLPYLTEEGMAGLDPNVAHEPRLALDGGHDGLRLYRGMFAQLARRSWAVPGVLEIDPKQAEPVCDLIREVWPAAHVTVIPDYSERDRVVVFRAGQVTRMVHMCAASVWPPPGEARG